MATELYRFHCTDGHELVTDRRGRTCQSATQARRHADRVALALMSAVDHPNWARWQVEVYDPKGRRVWLRAFSDVDIDVDLMAA